MPETRPGALRRALLSTLLVGGTVAAVALPAVPASADDRVTVAVGRPAMSAAARQHSAAVDDAARIQIEVVFDLQDEQGAADLATAVSTPGSAEYRRYVAPADWIARFAPTQETVDGFTAAAQQAGLTVDTVPASRLFALVSGSVGEVEELFATTLRSYAVRDQRLVAPTGTASLPASAARGVRTVLFDRPPVTSAAEPAKRPAKAVKCSSWWNQHRVRIPEAYGLRTAPTALCGYTAKQLRAASGLAGTDLTGAGQTVAVIDAFGSRTIAADLATFSRRNGLPAASLRQVVPARSTWTVGGGCTPSDWAIEQTLDLEAVHAVAPAADLVYVGAADCAFGMDAAVSTVLDRRLATIVSNSWGGTGLDTYADLYGAADEIALNVHQQLQAAAEGVGLYFASGDLGDDSPVFGSPAVDFPASSPWVTSVGGTTTALDRRNRVVFRTAWGDRTAIAKAGASRWTVRPSGLFSSGAGGGASTLFPAPAYQAGVVPASLAGGMRTSTDVSALASPSTGFAVGVTTGGRYRTLPVGGTSLATPIVAAQVALAQQRSGCVLGFLNPTLYAVRGTLADVAPSSNVRFAASGAGKAIVLTTFDRDTSLKARRGYDLPTGLGVLTPASLTALGRP